MSRRTGQYRKTQRKLLIGKKLEMYLYNYEPRDVLFEVLLLEVTLESLTKRTNSLEKLQCQSKWLSWPGRQNTSERTYLDVFTPLNISKEGETLFSLCVCVYKASVTPKLKMAMAWVG